MKAMVHIMLRNGILDPQGEVVKHALGTLGFDGVENLRIGKFIELDLDDYVTEANIAEMCDKLLANTVMESYKIEML